jgi:putative redox protein
VAKNVVEITTRWREGLTFEASAAARPAITVDGHSSAATSPVELLLVAAATCTASDVVLILQKQRVGLRGLEVVARGTRREQEPRRYTALHFLFTIEGDGADETKARRAIELSLEKYCSVVASLAPDIRVSYDVALR